MGQIKIARQDYEYVKNLPLHSYQKQALNFILTHRYAGLFLDVGMGKSLITLAALSMLPKKHTLIVAPKNIARATWIDEIEKWKAPLKHRSLIVDENYKQFSKKQRYEAYDQVLKDPPTVYFLNRDLIKDCVDYYLNNYDNKWPFEYVVLDESQGFKSYASTRFKKLKKVRPAISRLIELTGTPTPNGLMDLWSQIYLLDQGYNLGKNITSYRNTFFVPVKYIQNHPIKWKAIKDGNYDAEKDIYQRIKPLVISMKNTKLQLPPVTYVKDKVYLDDEQYKIYKQMLKKNVLQISPTLEVTSVNAGVLSNHLSQMASGTLYIDDTHKFIVIHDEKLKRVKYIIDNTPSPVLIAYHYQSDLKMMSNYFDKNKISYGVFDGTPNMIKKWNDRKIPVMLIQPASAGFGLNLQKGGHTLVWYTLPWSLEEYIQTNGRLARQGQTEPVVIHQLITDKTIDARILDALRKKNVSQSDLMTAVRFTLQSAGLGAKEKQVKND